MRKYKNVKIQIPPGVTPSPDATPSSALNFTDALNVRFYDAKLRKLGGWTGALVDNSKPVRGCSRRIFSYFYSAKFRYLIGSDEKLYEYINTTLTNITPLKTTATSTLGSNPIATTNTSRDVIITDAAHGRQQYDRIRLSGATTFAGIPAGDFNKEHEITAVTINTFTIRVATAATSTTTGGGAAIEMFDEIADGVCDVEAGTGYGGGLYGMGLYGVAKTFTNSLRYPRIWAIDRYGDEVVMTIGNQGAVYTYGNNNATAPTVLTNAPTDVDWLFVSDNAVCTLSKNRIKTSDVGDATDWTPAADSLAFEDFIEGAEDFISQIPATGGINLLFTRNSVYTFRYVGLPDIWITKPLDSATDGLIAPMARVSIGGVVFWMGNKDFYLYDGGAVVPIPNNTVKQYVYQNLNSSQAWKCHAFVNRKFNEIWFFYPSGSSLEPNACVIYNYKEGHWTINTMTRLAGESPLQISDFPLMVSSTTLYRHESGVNDDSSAMNAYATTNYAMIGSGDSLMDIMGMIPDSTQSGNVDLTVTTKLYPQSSTSRDFGAYTISTTTEKLDFRANGRLRKYTFEQDALNEDFIMGSWYEMIQPSVQR